VVVENGATGATRQGDGDMAQGHTYRRTRMKLRYMGPPLDPADAPCLTARFRVVFGRPPGDYEELA
jgi:hypothetical protein